MARKYVRYPGYSPRYTNFETALYVSRKARLMRGFALSPTRKAGNQYYFRSDRAPLKDNGEWIVTVSEAGGGEPIGPGGHPDGVPGVNCSSDVVKVQVRCVMHEMVSPNEPPYFPGWPTEPVPYDHPFARYSTPEEYEANLPLEYDGPWYGPLKSWVYWYKQGLGASLYYTIHEPYTYDGTGTQSSNQEWIRAVVFRSGNLYRSQIPDYIATCEAYNAVRFGDTQLTTHYVYELVSAGDCSGTFQDGGGGSTPPGAVTCEGSQSYACTCPDFTAEEHPYKVPLAPSHYRYRSWAGGTWSGIYQSLNFPCKHGLCCL